MSTILYPGTFDPVTNGHLDLIERATYCFSNVIVGVSTKLGKSPMFDINERVELITKTIKEKELELYVKVIKLDQDNLTVEEAEKYEAEKRGENFTGDAVNIVAKNPIEAIPTHKTEAPCGLEPLGVELRTPRSVAKNHMSVAMNHMEWGSDPLKESIKDTTKDTIKETFQEREPTTLSEKIATDKPYVDIPAGSSLDESTSNEIPGDDIPAVSVSSRDSASVKKDGVTPSQSVMLGQFGLKEFENAKQNKEFDLLESKYNSILTNLFLVIV